MAKWNCSCCAVGPEFHRKTTVKTGLRVLRGEGLPHRNNRPTCILTNLCPDGARTFRGGSTDLPNVAEGENRGHIVLGNTMRQSSIGRLQYSQPVPEGDDFNMDFEAGKKFSWANCCRSLAGRREGYMNKTSAMGGGTRSCSRGSRLPLRMRSPDLCRRKTNLATVRLRWTSGLLRLPRRHRRSTA